MLRRSLTSAIKNVFNKNNYLDHGQRLKSGGATRFKMMKPMLLAFDFDHTIIDDNSDIVVRKMLSNDKIAEIKHLYRSDGWTAYMQKIFNILHENGFSEQDIKTAVNAIPFTPDMESLFQFLQSNDLDTIIISDSNSIFIGDWLRNSGYESVVKSVFTNPAKYNESGGLEIEMYHIQDWCKLSTVNLCKGHILNDFIKAQKESGVTYSKVAYIGDGKNDYCPMLRLSEKDIAFPREGYSIMELVNNSDVSIKASIHPWKTGTDIMEVIKQNISANDRV